MLTWFMSKSNGKQQRILKISSLTYFLHKKSHIPEVKWESAKIEQKICSFLHFVACGVHVLKCLKLKSENNCKLPCSVEIETWQKNMFQYMKNWHSNRSSLKSRPLNVFHYGTKFENSKTFVSFYFLCFMSLKSHHHTHPHKIKKTTKLSLPSVLLRLITRITAMKMNKKIGGTNRRNERVSLFSYWAWQHMKIF